jgi:hypothetical protein
MRNLPYNASEENVLKSLFCMLGKIVKGGVQLARYHFTGASKGFGYTVYKI